MKEKEYFNLYKRPSKELEHLESLVVQYPDPETLFNVLGPYLKSFPEEKMGELVREILERILEVPMIIAFTVPFSIN